MMDSLSSAKCKVLTLYSAKYFFCEKLLFKCNIDILYLSIKYHNILVFLSLFILFLCLPLANIEVACFYCILIYCVLSD